MVSHILLLLLRQYKFGELTDHYIGKKVSEVTEIIEQEYKNPFGIHVNKEKLVNISSGVVLDDDIGQSIMNNVGKSRIAEFRQKLLIPKEISFHVPIKKSNYKSFDHVMWNIWTTKRDGSVKVAERKIF